MARLFPTAAPTPKTSTAVYTEPYRHPLSPHKTNSNLSALLVTWLDYFSSPQSSPNHTPSLHRTISSPTQPAQNQLEPLRTSRYVARLFFVTTIITQPPHPTISAPTQTPQNQLEPLRTSRYVARLFFVTTIITQPHPFSAPNHIVTHSARTKPTRSCLLCSAFITYAHISGCTTSAVNDVVIVHLNVTAWGTGQHKIISSNGYHNN